MSGEEKKDYEVGYKKPPAATRFQKGRSGNPSGRPKKVPPPLDPGIILESIDNEEILVMDKGSRRRMPKAEIQFRQLFAKAIKGDLATARLLMDMATKYFAPEEREAHETEVIGVTEAARRFGRNWPERIRKLNAGFGD
jgi:hypothetical protein